MAVVMSISQNDWTVLASSAGLDNRLVSGTTDVLLAPGVRAGDVATVLRYVATQFNAHVEKLHAGWCWGYHLRPIRGQTSGYSNHASATAIDLNAPSHPRQSANRYTGFNSAQVATIHSILAELGGIVRWGGDYVNPPYDGMHFEINATAAAVHTVALRLTTKVPMIAVDFSGSPPSVASLKAANVSAVLRYVGGDGGKHLSAAEAQRYLAAGIDVGGVNETTAQRALNGYSAGMIDARDGLADLSAKCGRPARCIGLAVDFDANASQLAGPIHEYFRGACAAVGVGRVLVYGGYYSVKAILDAKLATYAWQAAAWSGQHVDPRAGLYQTIGGHNIGGTDCDVNNILKPDFGQVYAKPPEEFTVSEAAAILAAVASLKADVANVKADVAAVRAEEAARYVVYTNRDHANVGAAKALAGAVGTVPVDVWAEQPLPAVAAAVAALTEDHVKLRADVTRLLELAIPGDVDGSPTVPPVTA
jgi:hypothetical protein